MPILLILSLIFCLTTVSLPVAQAASVDIKPQKNDTLVPHKALYEIELVATRSGSQISNIGGKMYYEWQPSCDAWVTDHRFNLTYEYADSPAMRITSDFSTYEDFDGGKFNFSARRSRDGDIYQELRGLADADKADFNMPKDLQFDLSEGTMFPMTHTLELARRLEGQSKFFSATVFDGSDDEGPVEINSFIGKPVNALQRVEGNDKIDMTLLNTPAWDVRMAVFPTVSDEETADYEMDMVFHQNGIISDMLIEYKDFSVTQKLVALEKINSSKCNEDVSSSGRNKK